MDDGVLQAKISDFGMSKTKIATQIMYTKTVGSTRWQPPEYFKAGTGPRNRLMSGLSDLSCSKFLVEKPQLQRPWMIRLGHGSKMITSKIRKKPKWVPQLSLRN